MISFYHESGYLDFWQVYHLPVPFIFVFGPRGVGKTYGALKFVKEEHKYFMYLRRQHTEYELIGNPMTFPFKVLNTDCGWNVCAKSINKYLCGFYEGVKDEDGIIVPEGAPIGVGSALSTFSNIRGIDLQDLDCVIYDEFIPEAHVRPIKEEGSAFMNMYETINRNRELKGKPALKMICLANSNRLANPIFMELGLVTIAERMKKRKQHFYMDAIRGFALIDTAESPISEKKEVTALYKIANKNSSFYKMAIDNTFIDFDGTQQISRPLKEYRPIFAIGELCIYKHKSKNVYYASSHISGSPDKFGISEVEIARCYSRYAWIRSAYMDNRIEFETYLCEALFNKYLF